MMIVEAAPISSVEFGNPLLPSLSIENATKDYKTDGESVRALDDISIQIGSGAFVAFVGRSGCGKSTLLNLAGAMDFPTSGHVRVDGITTDELSERELTTLRREKFGFIFQSFQLLHTLSVIENVELPLLLAGISPRQRQPFLLRLEPIPLCNRSRFQTRPPELHFTTL